MIGIKKAAFEDKGRGQVCVYDKFCLFEGTGNGVLVAKKSENCDCRDGAIRTGIGIEKYLTVAGTGIERITQKDVRGFQIFRYPSEDGSYLVEKVGFTNGGGIFYLFNEEGNTVQIAVSPGLQVRAVTAFLVNAPTEACAVVAGTDGVYALSLSAGDSVTLFDDGSRAICQCRNRVFLGRKGNVLYYSDLLVPWDFTESIDGAGKIQLPNEYGALVMLQTFRENVYAFFERGIMRLDVAGSAREFRLSVLPYSGENIFGDSVGTVGKYMIFLAENGLYRTDGKTVERICENLPIQPIREGQVCGQAVFLGRYAVWYTDVNGEAKQVVVVEGGESGYFSAVLDGLGGDGGKALCRYKAVAYEATAHGDLPDDAEYRFETGALDFGRTGFKTLRTLRFEGEGSFVLGVQCDGRSTETELEFSDGVAVAEICERGEEFSFVFLLDNGAEIRKMEAEVLFAS